MQKNFSFKTTCGMYVYNVNLLILNALFPIVAVEAIGIYWRQWCCSLCTSVYTVCWNCHVSHMMMMTQP